jgi:hypothetical protein
MGTRHDAGSRCCSIATCPNEPTSQAKPQADWPDRTTGRRYRFRDRRTIQGALDCCRVASRKWAEVQPLRGKHGSISGERELQAHWPSGNLRAWVTTVGDNSRLTAQALGREARYSRTIALEETHQLHTLSFQPFDLSCPHRLGDWPRLTPVAVSCRSLAPTSSRRFSRTCRSASFFSVNVIHSSIDRSPKQAHNQAE